MLENLRFLCTESSVYDASAAAMSNNVYMYMVQGLTESDNARLTRARKIFSPG